MEEVRKFDVSCLRLAIADIDRVMAQVDGYTWPLLRRERATKAATLGNAKSGD